MTEERQLVVHDGNLPTLQVSPQDWASRRKEFNAWVNTQLRDKVDFGRIPGTDKPTLLKPGAEKIIQAYGCTPEIEITRRDQDPNTGYLYIEVLVRLANIQTGAVIGHGIGCCSSYESKYRWRWEWWNGRNAPPDEDGWQRTRNGKWRRRVENQDLIDTWNTVIKMAKKRALVDAALTVSGASEMFTQDVEDLVEIDAPIETDSPPEVPLPAPTTTVAPAQARAEQPAKVDWPAFERSLEALSMTRASYPHLLGTSSPEEFEQAHDHEDLATIYRIARYAANMDIGLPKLCQLLGVGSLAQWVGEHPEDALPLTKTTIAKRLAERDDAQARPKAEPRLPEAMRQQVQKLAAEGGTAPAPEGYRGYCVGLLESLFTDDDKAVRSAKRHTLTAYLLGKPSSKDWTSGEAAALQKWACQSDGSTIRELAPAEAERIVVQYEAEHGQQKLGGA